MTREELYKEIDKELQLNKELFNENADALKTGDKTEETKKNFAVYRYATCVGNSLKESIDAYFYTEDCKTDPYKV